MCKLVFSFFSTRFLGSTLGIFLLLVTAAYAQRGEAARTLYVTDEEGQGLAGITIVLQGSTALSLYSDKQGKFVLPGQVLLPVELNLSGVGFYDCAYKLTESDLHAKPRFIIRMKAHNHTMDEVLVTGRRNNSYLINSVELGGKFSGSLKDLPQSVSMVSREFMEDKQAFAITDMVHDLAGVNQASAYDDVTIRGFNSGYGTGLRLVNGMRSGYGYGTSFWRTPLTVNLESIEVLKGPGASLFGDITPGGTINLVTKKPMEHQHAGVNFAVGSFQTYRSSLDLGGPLDSLKKVLYRLNVGYENARTFRDVNQRKSILVAPSFSFRPRAGTLLDVDLTYDNFDGYLDRGLGIRNNDFYGQSRAFNVSQPTDFLKTSFLTVAARFKQQMGEDVSLHVHYMKSIYSEQLEEFRTLNTFANPPENTIMNMRFQSKNARDYMDNLVSYIRYSIMGEGLQHELVFGADYAQYAGDKDNLLREARSRMVNGEAIPLTIDLQNPAREIIDVSTYVWRPQAEFPFLNPYKSLGIYLQDQLRIGNRLHVIMGLRHELYRSSSADLQNSFETKQHVWLPRLGLTYRVNRQINYFASFSQGYVPVGADFIHNYQNYGAQEAFRAERSFQIETGLKTGFFNNQLQTELSLFHIERENMLIATGEQSEAGFPVYRQSGEVISSGIELDFRGQVTPQFQVMANYSFNTTEVRSSGLAGEKGQPLGNAPRHMGGLWMKYVCADGLLKGLGAGAGIYHVGQRRMDNAAQQDTDGMNIWDKWPGYETVNTALYYHVGGLKVTLHVNNLFDRYYYLGGFDYTRGFVGAPRNAMLSIGYSW